MKKRLFVLVLALVLFTTVLTLTAFAEQEKPDVWEVGPSEIHSYEPNAGYLSAELILSQEEWPSSAECYRDVLINPAVYDECLESEWGTVSFTVTLDTPILMEWEIDPATGKATEAGNEAKALWYRDYVWSCIDAVLLDHPERPDLRYETVYAGVSGTQDTNGNTVVFTVHQITVDYIDIVTADYDEAVFMAAVERAEAALNDDDGPYDVDAAGKSIYEKLDAINDYLCNNVTYDQDTDWVYHQTAYTAFVDGWSVCAGYSASFKLFCDIYGIPCMVVNGYSDYVSESQRHAWNYVGIDENRYAVDVTWNDNDDQSGEQSSDLYFLVGSETVIDDKKFGESHLPMHRYLPSPALSADAYNIPEASGTCGENLTWVLTSDGTLTISGEGVMDYDTSAPWRELSGKIYQVVIKEGVTSVGWGAFRGCSNLHSVTLPHNMGRIGEEAFRDCVGLTSITIDAQFIDASAFQNCTGLISVTTNAMFIGRDAFRGCTSLTSLELLEGVGSIESQAFGDCTSLTSVVIPQGVGYIASEAFGNDAFGLYAGLTTVFIPDSVTDLGSSAFYKCALSDVYYGGTKAQWEELLWSNSGRLEGVPDDMIMHYNSEGEARIMAQPTDQAAEDGYVYFAVKAKGDGLTYQWQVRAANGTKWNKTSLKGYNTDTLRVPVNDTNDGRHYRCVITDAYGNTAYSNEATLTMIIPVTIVTQPTDVTVGEGQTAKVTVAATGDGLTYKWYYKNAGASKFSYTSSFTGNNYSVKMNSARNGRQVYCIISDKYGNEVQTDTVTLTMGNTVEIVTQPTDVTVGEGQTAKVTVKASGDGLTYKWYFKNPDKTKFSYTSTFTGNTYTISSMDAARSGRQVYCVISDKYGNSVTTDTVTLTMANPVKIVTQPTSVVVANGEVFCVTVKATGDGLAYKWYFKNTDDAKFKYTSTFKGDTYSTTMNADRNGRQLYCVITDKYGNKVQTDTVTVTMGNVVKIVTQPTDVTVAKGKIAKVTVKAEGDGLTYKWYFKNPGKTKFSYTSTFTGNTYTISSMDAARSGRQVYCVISDKYGNSVTTDTVTLTMANPVKIVTQPTSVVVANGEVFRVTVKATGDGLAYKWYFKNTDDAKFKYTSTFKGDTYSTTMNADRNGRQLYCVITDKYGNKVQTDTVTVTMGNVVKIVTQPTDVTVAKGKIAKVTVKAEGDGLTYKWYYKNAGASRFTLTDTFDGNYYQVSMTAARSGRQVYCVISDKYGNSVTTDTVTLRMK